MIPSCEPEKAIEVVIQLESPRYLYILSCLSVASVCCRQTPYGCLCTSVRLLCERANPQFDQHQTSVHHKHAKHQRL